jgi:hypothetical protein
MTATVGQWYRSVTKFSSWITREKIRWSVRRTDADELAETDNQV